MRNQNGLTDRVLKLGGDYFAYASIEGQMARTATAQAAQGYKTDILERMVEVQGRRHQARHDLLEIIPVLAVQRQDAGHDVRDLLRFQHRIDGGGGPAAAVKGWEDLKVELQRVQLLGGRVSKPTPTPESIKGKWKAEAMGLVHDHPEWTDTKIAGQVGVHRSTLTRCDDYQRVAIEARQKRPRPKGFGRSGSIEAIAPD